MPKATLTVHIPVDLVNEYTALRRAGLTFAPSFTAFLIQSIEGLLLEVLRPENQPHVLYRYALALMRENGTLDPVQRKPLSARRGRQKRKASALGPVEDTSIPMDLVRRLDAVFLVGARRRSAAIRACFVFGIKRARTNAALWQVADGLRSKPVRPSLAKSSQSNAR